MHAIDPALTRVIFPDGFFIQQCYSFAKTLMVSKLA